jgi:hypothetical protein
MYSKEQRELAVERFFASRKSLQGSSTSWTTRPGSASTTG